MRRFTVRLSPAGGWFHPVERSLADAEGVRRVAIHKVRLVADDRGLVLYELAGDPDRARALLADVADCEDYHLQATDGRIFVFSWLAPNDTVRRLLRTVRDVRVFLDPPMTYTPAGDLRVTVLAAESSFAEAMETVPGDVAVTLEAKREFRPGEDVFLARLTAVQRRVLETAIDLGYYESPRRATYEDVGAALDLAGSTVGEHLRKIEAKLVAHVVADASGIAAGRPASTSPG